ncbi:MAG TPA: (5-formylfuran-3-yl)methyl phosphate synthase [Candidatus Binatia bacterium]|nr:(5-formylfuran-3-yl)methyl phosphate synthase [Candidatus Binatia bacterium]
MKLLISPMNHKEALEAITGGADIIDVKNPKEGALGANYPWVIKRIKEATPKNVEVSCTLGDVGNLPGSVSLAALGAASLGVDYIKVGLYGVKTPEQALFLLQNARRAAKECNPKIKIAVACYADAEKNVSISPLSIPEIAQKAKVDIAMIDTSVKDGKNLFDYLSIEELKKFVDSAHYFGLKVALAGSLRKQDLPVVYSLGVDIAGLRGAACTNSNRVTGQITKKRVSKLIAVIREAETSAPTKRA